MGLVPFRPVIPENQKEIDEWIEAFAESNVGQIDADGVLRTHMLGRLVKLGINISQDTPPSVL